jgi:hypothetical protein
MNGTEPNGPGGPLASGSGKSCGASAEITLGPRHPVSLAAG